MLHAGYLRHYTEAIRILCERGHTVHVVLVRPVKHPADVHLLDGLTADCPSFTFGPAPVRRATDPWRSIAWLTRVLLDVSRYGHPDFAGADALRERSIGKAGLGYLGALLLRPYLRHLASPTSRENAKRRTARLRRLSDAVPASRTVTEELASFRPDLVLASPVVEFMSLQLDILKSARALGVPTGVCIASWDNLTNKGLVRFRPDRLFVWNGAQRGEAEEYHDIDPQTVVMTGAPRFDQWFERSASRSRDELCDLVGLHRGPYLLYLCSSAFVAPDEVAFVRRWLTALRESGLPELERIGVLIRPYPHNAEPWREVELRELGNVAVHPRAGAHPDGGEAAAVFYDSIALSEATVGINTTAMIEAAIVGKATYTILDPQFAATQEKTLHFHYLREDRGGFVHEAASLDEHVEQLADGLARGAENEERIRSFVAAFIRPQGVDRPATEVLADAFEELAGGRAGRTRAGLELAR